MADRVSITFGPYLTGGVPDGAPLWREPPAKPSPGDAPVPRGERVPDASASGEKDA